MGYKEMYNEWLNNPYFDEETKAELKAIAGDEKEIEDRFYMDLEFGTAGLRGVIGAGTNRMNVYTVRKATQRKRLYKKQRAILYHLLLQCSTVMLFSLNTPIPIVFPY